jgi:hypothetical protein
MEIAHKKITDAEIYEKEKELASKVSALVSEYEEKFSDIGYTLETEFLRDNDSGDIEPEEKNALRASKIADEAGAYENGYSSHVKITVKHVKTDADTSAEKEISTPEGFVSEEEAELLRNEQQLAQAEAELKRSVAFTTMMFVRVYKTFWREIISISDNTDEISADVEEFYTVLKEKHENGDKE